VGRLVQSDAALPVDCTRLVAGPEISDATIWITADAVMGWWRK
jgi:hypothetical protein